MQGVPTKASKFSTGEYNKATADTKLKTSLANSTKPTLGGSTQIPSVGTSGVQNDGSGNQGYGVGGSVKKPVKVKTKPRAKVKGINSTLKSADVVSNKPTKKQTKKAAVKADLKDMPIIKDATSKRSSRKSRRIKKTVSKAVQAKKESIKAIKNIKSSSSASDVAKNQAKALQKEKEI